MILNEAVAQNVLEHPEGNSGLETCYRSPWSNPPT
jgi:hypothetical protein